MSDDPSSKPAALKLAAFELAQDGGSVRLDLRDESGKPVSLSLSVDCLSPLLMTLPGIIEQSLRRRYRDPSLRMVYSAGDWKLHLADDGVSLILSLATPDRFEVSFALSPATRREIAHALAAAESEPGSLPGGVALH
jgi:hypothetical protein